MIRYDTYKYQFKVGNRIVEHGITKDLDRREAELLEQWPGGRIKQVGRITTAEAAHKWCDQKPPIVIKYLDPQPPPGIGSVSRGVLRRAWRSVLKAAEVK